MLLPAMRPVFRRELPVPLPEVARAVQWALAQRRGIVVGSVAGPVIELYPTRARRHLFSPRLSVVLYPREGTLVVGRYGPNPDIWTFFVALYALCFFSAFAGTLGAWAQWLAGEAPSWWVGIPVGMLGAVCVYLAAMVGRHAAREQVSELEAFFLGCLDEAEEPGTLPAAADTATEQGSMPLNR
jgi:hypothetical protein